MSERTLIAAVLLALCPVGAEGQDWRTTTIMRQATTEQSLDVEVGYGAGRLEIEPARGRMLYQASVRYDARTFRPMTSYADGRLRIGLDTHRSLSLPRDGDADGGRMTLRLGRGVPLDLDLEFGAAQAEIELGGLSMRSLHLATGASETRVRFSEPNPIALERIEFDMGAADFSARGLGHANAREIRLNGGVADMELDFSGAWRGDTNLEIDFGLGSLTLRIPREVGVRVEKETLLAGFTAPRMSRRGDAYYSDNWDSAQRHLTVRIDGAFGDITLDWID